MRIHVGVHYDLYKHFLFKLALRVKYSVSQIILISFEIYTYYLPIPDVFKIFHNI